jgi:hypothetical protein
MQAPPKMAKYTEDNATGLASADPNYLCQEKTQNLQIDNLKSTALAGKVDLESQINQDRNQIQLLHYLNTSLSTSKLIGNKTTQQNPNDEQSRPDQEQEGK